MPIISKEEAAKLTSLSQIDWSSWEPLQKATLLFLSQNDQMLLIRKKRGLGAGKINAAGGRLEPTETEKECAVREMQEELCITVKDPKYAGEVDFQFTDGYCFHLVVFTGTEFEGIPTETDEAIPLWYKTNEIPYDEMWEDDIHWLPTMIRGERFYGRFLFDDDTMLDGWMAPASDVEALLTSPHRFE
jgi:8-oxo-dGTP diphosphatase